MRFVWPLVVLLVAPVLFIANPRNLRMHPRRGVGWEGSSHTERLNGISLLPSVHALLTTFEPIESHYMSAWMVVLMLPMRAIWRTDFL
ncbi:hypothetical protein A6R71_15085 [Xanthomonas translucens pv. arrhenatheri]|nr:hypothetical protein A6R71_15085 [Xanthomonas translucens pv. arrhenatheri]